MSSLDDCDMVCGPGPPIGSSSPVSVKSKESTEQICVVQDFKSTFLNLSENERKLFCEDKHDIFKAPCNITYAIFGELLGIAEDFSNRNKVLNNMLRNLNKNINKTDTSISNVVKKFNRHILRTENLPDNQKSIAMQKIIIETERDWGCLTAFNTGELEKGKIIVNGERFVLTNEIFSSLCRIQAQIQKLTWEAIADFLYKHYRLSQPLSYKNVQSYYASLTSKLDKLGHGKKDQERAQLLNNMFTLPSSRYQNENNEIEEIVEMPDKESDAWRETLVELNTTKETLNELSSNLSQLQNSYDELSAKEEQTSKEKDRTYGVLSNSFDKLSVRYEALCKELDNKREMLSRYEPRNVKKREKRKEDKIGNLESENEKLGREVLDLKEKLTSYKRKYECQRQRTCYYKKELAKGKEIHSSEKLKEINEYIQYYENLTEELKEKVDTLEKDHIETFMDGRYSDEIREVYYDLLRKNVGVENCSEIIRTVLQKLVHKTVGRLPQKSAAATMMVEAQIISKMQVRDAMLASSNNVLHTDGTKYRFKEVGSYQVNTDSGSYTMGIEEMFSGEAVSYMDTFRDLLGEMSRLVVPEDAKDSDVQKILYNFKCLLTDRCSVNGSFFEDFQKWRNEILPFVVENYDTLPEKEKESISNMHHVFCALHVIHNLGIYAEKAVKEWEKVVAEDNNTQGGFKNSNNSRSYDLLFELSKLTSVGHGDQRNGKADEWIAYLDKLKAKNHMVSFLHHRFNIIFVIGGATYYHRENLKDFVSHLDGSNFLHSSIAHDISSPIFLAAFRALGLFNKLVSGPLYRKIEEKGHIFSLNDTWENLSNLLDALSKDASSLMEGEIDFHSDLKTKDAIFDELVHVTDDPIFETLTQECLEMICCTCSVMVKSQLKDQLVGGKYHRPTSEVIEQTKNCLRTNVLSERDFAQYDRRLTMKPVLSTVAACGVIMYGNNHTSDWLAKKSDEEVKQIVEIAMKNKDRLIENYRKRKNEIMKYKVDMIEKRKLEKEIKEQQISSEKEGISQDLHKCGGLWRSKEDVEKWLAQSKSKAEAIKCQIKYRKIVLGQKFPDRKLGQMGEANKNGKYVPYSVCSLKENLLKIIEFMAESTETRATCLVRQQNIRHVDERKRLLETAKSTFKSAREKTGGPSNDGNTKLRKQKKKKVPQFFGKKIRHKYEDNGKDVWFKGVVVSCLDDNEYSTDCEFEIEYEGSSEKYDVKLVEDWKKGWVVIEGKAKVDDQKDIAGAMTNDEDEANKKRKLSENEGSGTTGEQQKTSTRKLRKSR